MLLNGAEFFREGMADLLSGYSALLAPGYPCLAAPLDTEVANVNGKSVDFVGLGRNLVGLQNFRLFLVLRQQV